MLAVLKNRKGVTLVELLAVIVILGIIAAIAVPTIGNLIERQRENAANATYEAVLEAGRLYILQEDLVATDTFTAADLVTEGFLESNPFTPVGVTFTVGANNTFTITAPTGDITIDGFVVATVA